MKKIIIFLNTIIISITITFGQTATFSLPDLGGDIGAGSVWFDITIENISPGDDMGTFQLFFRYDPQVLTPVGNWAASPTATGIVYPSENFPFYEWLNNNQYDPINGEVQLTWLNSSGSLKFPSPGEVVCSVEFAYTGDPDYAELNWQTTNLNSTFSGNNEKGITSCWTFGGVEYSLLLMDGSIGPTCCPPTTWTGAIDDVWNNSDNWDNGVPTFDGSQSHALIPDNTPNEPVIYSSAISPELIVISGASLTIYPSGDLTTYGPFTCDGDFIIMTDATYGYSGSFINLDLLAGGGMFYHTRNMFCTGIGGGSVDPFAWHYLAAPIDGFSTDDLTDYYVSQWDEPTSMWMSFDGSEPCMPYIPAENLDVLETWSINYATDWNCPGGTGLDLEFLGPFVYMHNGPYSASATYTAGTYAGWNMFGNPYPSGLDMNAIVWDTNAIPGTAFYDGCVGNYVYWTPALGDYIMTPDLGFFTEWTAPGTFSLTGTERAHTPDIFWETDVDDLLTIKITNEEKSDITHIRFMEEAEIDFAKDGDFHKLFSQEIPQIYTIAGDDKLAVNVRPATQCVPMGMTCTYPGTFTIAAIETSDFFELFLEDFKYGIITSLLTNSYSFEHTVGDDEIRFLIHFTHGGINDNLKNLVNIWSNQSNIYVLAPGVTGDIVVFNIMGQEIVRTNIEPGLNIIPMSSVNTYYVVKVLTSDNAVTGKVFIK